MFRGSKSEKIVEKIRERNQRVKTPKICTKIIT